MQRAGLASHGGASLGNQGGALKAKTEPRGRLDGSGSEQLSGAQGVAGTAPFELVLQLVTPSEPVAAPREVQAPSAPERSERSGGGERGRVKGEQGQLTASQRTAEQSAEGAKGPRAPADSAAPGGKIALPTSAPQPLNPAELLALNQLLERLAAGGPQGDSLWAQLEPRFAGAEESSPRALWALMNGWAQARSQGEQLAQLSPSLLSQARELLSAAPQQLAQQVAGGAQNAPVVPLNQPLNAGVMAPPPSYLSPRSAPSATQLQLSEGQRAGLIKQIADGFRVRGGGKQLTEIRLHPSELGVVRVKVELQGDQLRLWFAADNAGVSETIAQHIEELRQALLEQEINLAGSSFFDSYEALQREGQEQGEDEEDSEPSRRRRGPLRRRPTKPSGGTRLLPNRFQATI